MAPFVALFRGINVGGKNSLPMKALVRLAREQGYDNVKTLIQSGNVVFQASRDGALSFERNVGNSIESEFGFRPHILVLEAAELRKAVDANPFPEVRSAPRSLHLFFLADTPINPDLEAMHAIKSPSEEICLAEEVFYLYAPEGIGRSRLASRAERLLGVPATARNWNTVLKLLEIAEHS